MAIYIQTENEILQIDRDIDLSAFVKSTLRKDESDFLTKLKNVEFDDGAKAAKTINENELSLAQNDLLLKNIRGQWYALDEQNQQKAMLKALMEAGKFDMGLLKDDMVKAAYVEYKKDMGEDYSEEDFKKDITLSEIIYELNENSGNSYQYLNDVKESINQTGDMKVQNQELESQNPQYNPLDLSNQLDKNDELSASSIMRYLNNEGEYKHQFVWPFERDIRDNTYGNVKLMGELTGELNKLTLKELRQIHKNIKEKNEALEQALKHRLIENIKNETIYNAGVSIDDKEELKNIQNDVNKAAQVATEMNNEAIKDELGDLDDAHENAVLMAQNAALKASDDTLNTTTENRDYVAGNALSSQQNSELRAENGELNSIATASADDDFIADPNDSSALDEIIELEKARSGDNKNIQNDSQIDKSTDYDSDKNQKIAKTKA